MLFRSRVEELKQLVQETFGQWNEANLLKFINLPDPKKYRGFTELKIWLPQEINSFKNNPNLATQSKTNSATQSQMVPSVKGKPSQNGKPNPVIDLFYNLLNKISKTDVAPQTQIA